MIGELLKVHLKGFIYKYTLEVHTRTYEELIRKEICMQNSLGSVCGAKLWPINCWMEWLRLSSSPLIFLQMLRRTLPHFSQCLGTETCLHEETDIGFWSGNLFQYVLNKIFHLRKVSIFFPEFCRNILFNIQWKVNSFSRDFHSPCFQKIALCSQNYLNATVVAKLLHRKLCRKNMKHS